MTAISRSNQNITRLDYKRTHGWWVRFERGEDHIRKLFSDKTYGGKNKALSAARQFRDGLIGVLPSTKSLVPTPGKVFREKLRRRRASGEYVYYEFWGARIQISPGSLKRTRYSIGLHGSKQAKKLAEGWLAEHQLQQQENYELP